VSAEGRTCRPRAAAAAPPGRRISTPTAGAPSCSTATRCAWASERPNGACASSTIPPAAPDRKSRNGVSIVYLGISTPRERACETSGFSRFRGHFGRLCWRKWDAPGAENFGARGIGSNEGVPDGARTRDLQSHNLAGGEILDSCGLTQSGRVLCPQSDTSLYLVRSWRVFAPARRGRAGAAWHPCWSCELGLRVIPREFSALLSGLLPASAWVQQRQSDRRE